MFLFTAIQIYSMLITAIRSVPHSIACHDVLDVDRIYLLHRSSLPQHGRQVAMIVIIEGVPWLGVKSTEAPIKKNQQPPEIPWFHIVSYRGFY